MRKRFSAARWGWCAIVAIDLVCVAQVGMAHAALDVELYAQLLERHTRSVEDTAGTRIDYPALSRSAPWQRLIHSLETSTPSKLRSREAKLAFWINAYNILAIQIVLRGYPLESIRDLGNFLRPVWVHEAATIEGRSVTLDEIEHQILRPLGEPRIHAAIVCASISCPSLRREPWLAERIDAQFDDTLRHFLASPAKGLRVDRSSGVVAVSRIFDWFAEDFERAGGVLAFVARYAPDADAAWLRENASAVTLRYLDYDWNLNDLATARR